MKVRVKWKNIVKVIQDLIDCSIGLVAETWIELDAEPVEACAKCEAREKAYEVMRPNGWVKSKFK